MKANLVLDLLQLIKISPNHLVSTNINLYSDFLLLLVVKTRIILITPSSK